MRRFLLVLLLTLAALPGFSRAYVVDSTWRDGVTLGAANTGIGIPTTFTHASTTWTIEMWAKTSSTAQGVTIFDATSCRFFWRPDSGADRTKLAFYTGSYTNSNFTAPSDGRWHHVVLTASGTQFFIFLDGVQSAEITNTARQLTGAMAIGSNANFGYSFPGSIKNFRIWSTVRTADELRANASLRLTGNEPGLLYYMPGDDGANSDPVLPQTVFGPSSFDSGSPNVLKLLGTDIRVVAPTSGITNFPFTISRWLSLADTSGSSQYGTCYLGSSTTALEYIAFRNAWLTGSVFSNGGAAGNKSGSNYADNAYVNSSPYPTSTYQYVTGVFRSATARDYYINGILRQTETNNVPFPASSPTSFVIGPPYGGYGYNRTAYVSLWSRALTQPEIAAEMLRSTPATTTGLVAYYPLNETTGSTAYDIGPNGYHGTITGGARVSLVPKTTDPVSYKSYPAFAGRYGVARTELLDGINDKITIPASSTFKAATAATWGGWFNIPTFPVSSAAILREDMPIVARAVIAISPTGGVYAGMRDDDGGAFIIGPKNLLIPLGTWVHIMHVVDTVADTQAIYFNGALASQVSTVMGAFPNTWPTGTTVGFDGSTYLKTYALHIGRWSRALTPQEIQQQMYMDSPVSYQNLLGYWKMDEGTGNCLDSSGSGNAAVVTGATWSVLPNNNGSITNTSTSWQRTLINAFPPSFRSFLVTP